MLSSLKYDKDTLGPIIAEKEKQLMKYEELLKDAKNDKEASMYKLKVSYYTDIISGLKNKLN